MGHLTSLGSALPLITKTISSVNEVDRAINGNRKMDRTSNLAHAQKIEQNRLDEKIVAQKAAFDTSILNAEKNNNDRRRQTALKSAMARQRAIFGGSGLDHGGDTGSGAAVLSGLLNESEQEKAASETIYNLRRRIIDDHVQNIRTRNLLDESQFWARKKIKSGGLL